MIDYNNILYVGAKKTLICRDGNEQYAKSMDLKFIDYDDFLDNYIFTKYINPSSTGAPSKYDYAIIFDISVGWTTLDNIAGIEEYLKYYKGKKCRVFFRLVDQFKHQMDSDIYCIMKELSKIHKVPIIGAYDVDYYGLEIAGVVPYPYLSEDEYDDSLYLGMRLPKALLSGSDIKEIYPMRYKLKYLNSNNIDILGHPGYSGKSWSTGCIGNDYLNKLYQYKFMICTTCVEDYELLKYIECAEAGCIPIGELPSSLKGTEAEKYFIEIPKEAIESCNLFDEWFSNIQIGLDFNEFSMGYREAIKNLNDKENLKNTLLTIVNK